MLIHMASQSAHPVTTVLRHRRDPGRFELSELDVLLAVLRPGDAVDAVTSAEDVDDAKPAPDIIATALAKASARADEAVMVGDAVWDMAAARRAGVTAIGVLSGGSSADLLRAAGAAAVYDDVADLLAKLDESPLSPDRGKLS